MPGLTSPHLTYGFENHPSSVQATFQSSPGALEPWFLPYPLASHGLAHPPSTMEIPPTTFLHNPESVPPFPLLEAMAIGAPPGLDFPQDSSTAESPSLDDPALPDSSSDHPLERLKAAASLFENAVFGCYASTSTTSEDLEVAEEICARALQRMNQLKTFMRDQHGQVALRHDAAGRIQRVWKLLVKRRARAAKIQLGTQRIQRAWRERCKRVAAKTRFRAAQTIQKAWRARLEMLALEASRLRAARCIQRTWRVCAERLALERLQLWAVQRIQRAFRMFKVRLQRLALEGKRRKKLCELVAKQLAAARCIQSAWRQYRRKQNKTKRRRARKVRLAEKKKEQEALEAEQERERALLEKQRQEELAAQEKRKQVEVAAQEEKHTKSYRRISAVVERFLASTDAKARAQLIDLLPQDAEGHDARNLVINTLKKNISDEHEHNTVRMAATVALSHFGPWASPGTPDLIDVLLSPNSSCELLAAAVETLGFIGRDACEAVPYILPLLLRTGDANRNDLQYQAARCLGKLAECPESIHVLEALEILSTSGDEKIAHAALKSMRMINKYHQCTAEKATYNSFVSDLNIKMINLPL